MPPPVGHFLQESLCVRKRSVPNHARQHHQKIFPAIAAAIVVGPRLLQEQGSHLALHIIAGGVAQTVVDLLEMAQLHQQHRPALAPSSRRKTLFR